MILIIKTKFLLNIYYLQVLVDDLSIELDSDLHYHHHYHLDDVIEIHMYSDKGPRVPFGGVEYDAIFTHHWDSIQSKRLTIASLLSMRMIRDITKSVNRNSKLIELGI